MTEAFKQIFVLFVAILLVVNGIIIMKKRHFEIGIGGGRVAVRPLFTIPIRGIGAITFGVANIICGLIIVSYLIILFVRQEAVPWDEVFSIATIVILGILALGLIVGFLLQFLIELTIIFGKKNGSKSE